MNKLLIIFNVLLAGSSTITNNTPNTLISELSQDSSFSESQYPLLEDAIKDGKHVHEMEFIDFKVAEDQSLILYFYNPTSLRTAKSISIDRGRNQNINEYVSYNLDLLDVNSSNTIHKYKVLNLQHSILETKYYYRFGAFQRDLFDDELMINKNEYASIGLNAGLEYLVTATDNGYQYYHKELDTIQILNPYCGFVSYLNSSSFMNIIFHVGGQIMSNYIAFDTDHDIDSIQEISINYNLYDFHLVGFSYSNIFTPQIINDNYESIQYSNQQPMLNQVIYSSDVGTAIESFKRIQLVSDLHNKNYEYYNADDEKYIYELPEVKKCKWILRFAESDYKFKDTNDPNFAAWIIDGQICREVQILRIKYTYKGLTYNLAAVDSVKSGTIVTGDDNTNIALKWIIIGLVLLIVFLYSLPFLLKFILKILMLPIRLINKLFENSNKRRKRKW